MTHTRASIPGLSNNFQPAVFFFRIFDVHPDAGLQKGFCDLIPSDFKKQSAMIKSLTFLIILLGLSCFADGQGKWRPGEKEVRIRLHDERETLRLTRMGLDGDIYSRQGFALLYVTSAEIDQLKAEGFEAEVIVDDLNRYSRDFWLSRDQYHTYDEIIDAIDSLVDTYPSICKKYDYGLSVEGRQLCALKISDYVSTDNAEPEIFFDGGIHGDEIGGPENLVRFAEFLCDSYGNDPTVTDLVNNREIWLYIMVNPDGRVNMTRYNTNNVDLNRDYGYMWDGAGASPGYYSQPETRAIRECLLSNQFVLSISYHSGSQYLAYTWSYRPDNCPDQPHVDHMAALYASVSGYDNLAYGQGYTGMYPINGSSKDAAYGTIGSIGWTMEISYDKQPPASQIQYYYDLNAPAMLSVIKEAGYGIHGTITDAVTGYPVAGAVFTDDFYPCYNDPVIGDYHKYLLEGNYSVRAEANGYQPVVLNVTVDSAASTEVNFILEPEDGHYAYRVIACQIPNNNFYDEARTCAALFEPDNVNYSIGHQGWIILDMQDTVFDGPGDELIVHEGDTDPEGFSCYVSTTIDGPWIPVGNGTGTASFDFFPAGLTEARYIKIVDDGVGPVAGDNAGYDLDAVEVPDQPEVIFLDMDCHIEDPAGNNNGRIDPGEIVNLIVALRSLGSVTVENGSTYLNYDDQFILVADPEAGFGPLEYSDTAIISFSMSCSSFCPTGSVVMMALNVTTNDGMYQHTFPFSFTAGQIVEDWETAGFTKFGWLNSGDKNWAINFQEHWEGNCSARSGNIDDGEFTAIEVTMDVIGYDDISFYRKVSSETNSDFLWFYIDNNPAGYWSGELPWEEAVFQVTPGYHTFKWAFEKDWASSTGSDCAWIDYIVFPSCNLNGVFKALANALPHELCGPGPSQLAAFVTGGTGNYTFSWAPGGLIDDPSDQYPVATPAETTLFTVEVGDGENTTGSSVYVKVYDIPETPVILQQGDSLIGSTTAWNQWYNSNGPVPGETGKVFFPETEGEYFDIVSSEYGCLSDTSNIIDFHFTGLSDAPSGYEPEIYPNPFRNNITIAMHSYKTGIYPVEIVDMTGNIIYKNNIIITDNQDITIIPAALLQKGVYLILIMDEDSNILLSKKIIKT